MLNRNILYKFYWITIAYSIGIGFLIAYFSQFLYYKYYNFDYGIDYISKLLYLAPLIFLTNYFIKIGARIGAKSTRNIIYYRDSSLWYSSLFLSIIGVIGVYLYVSELGKIPLFYEGPADEMRFYVTSGWHSFLSNQLGFAVLLNILLIYRKGKKIKYITLLLIQVFILLLTVSRGLVLFPLLIGFIYYLSEEKKSLLKYVPILLIMLIFSFIFGFYRAFGYDQHFDYSILMLRLVTDIAPEFRDFMRLTDIIPSIQSFWGFDPIISALSGFIPSDLFSILGLNKNDYYFQVGLEITRTLNPNVSMWYWSGTRTLLFGELYLVHGWISLYIIFPVFGFFLGKLISKSQKYSGIKNINFPLIFALALIISILYGINFIPNKIIQFGIAYFIVNFFNKYL